MIIQDFDMYHQIKLILDFFDIIVNKHDNLFLIFVF